jgi:hypothetical protein
MDMQFRDDAQRHWLVRRMLDITRLTGWQSAKQIADGCESGWIKAHLMKKGPPYTRHPDIEAMMPSNVWENPRRIDRKIEELNRQDKRLILVKSEQAHFAMGLLAVENDFARLELTDSM